MAEATQFRFSHREVVEALIKKQGIHEGLWMLYVEFSFAATNVGPDENTLNPAAIAAVTNIGLMKADKPTNLTVDAAEINPS